MEVKIEFGLTDLMNKVNKSVDETTMLYVHKRFADRISPWTPFREGVLDSSVEIHPEYIRYNGPYAHYVYEGEVYGPNIPITQGGVIVGWRSPPLGKGSKTPTGRRMEYTHEYHPLATAHWDKVAMETQLDPFTQEIKEYLIRRIHNG